MSQGRKIVGVGWVLAALLAAVWISGPAGASSSHKASIPKPSHKLLQQGSVTFWECKAKTTRILIGVNSLTLHPGDTLNINFIVRNNAATACNYVAPYTGAALGSTASTLTVGPCGAIGFEVDTLKPRNLWPGVTTFPCPDLGAAQLAPGTTVVGSGTWNQTLPNSNKRVPVGTYTLVVAGHYAFALQIKKH